MPLNLAPLAVIKYEKIVKNQDSGLTEKTFSSVILKAKISLVPSITYICRLLKNSSKTPRITET